MIFVYNIPESQNKHPKIKDYIILDDDKSEYDNMFLNDKHLILCQFN